MTAYLDDDRSDRIGIKDLLWMMNTRVGASND